jgi:hypothetical protein
MLKLLGCIGTGGVAGAGGTTKKYASKQVTEFLVLTKIEKLT